jgi:hypothetical protein
MATSPFDLASVFRNAEAIKGMRRQGVLDELQTQYLGQRMAQDANQEQRAVAAEGRQKTEFDQEQAIVGVKLLNMASAEIAQNPAAVKRWAPILAAADPQGQWDKIDGVSPEQIQAAAKQHFAATSQALQAYNAGSGATQAKPSALIEQYQMAASQGYQGSYLDFVQEQSQRQVGAQYGAPTDVPGVGIVQPSRTQGAAGNIVISPEANVAAAEATRAGADAAARADVAASAEQQKEFTANQRTLDVWNVAKQGLMRALSGTTTGPASGRLPAVTSGQQIAEGAVAAVAPVLKQLFRSAGEGVFTDRDQQLLLDMVPQRTDHPETITAKVEMIDAIIQAKLAASIPGDASNAPAGSSLPDFQNLSDEELKRLAGVEQ